MTELSDKRDKRDPETIGKLIISRPTNLTACQAADYFMNPSKDGVKRDPTGLRQSV